ncbi:hypothetical protein Hanom_Chr00s101237g01803941 [Helianthus anomalus]
MNWMIKNGSKEVFLPPKVRNPRKMVKQNVITRQRSTRNKISRFSKRRPVADGHKGVPDGLWFCRFCPKLFSS